MPNRSLTFLFLVTLTITTRAHAQQSRPAWCSHLPRPEYKKLERVRTSEDWFEVYRIQPGVFAIYEPHQYEEVISYLILGSKDALLLDTGMGIGDIRKLVNNLTRLPVGVLNTHTHPDHIGGNYQFQKILGADTPFTRKNSRGYNSAEVKEFLKGDHLCGKLPRAFDPALYSIHRFSVSEKINDGEWIDLGERKLQILMTPGHTPDSLCLLDRDHGLLFTGDTYYPGPIYLFSPETDFEAYGRSVHRIAMLAGQLKLLLPAHNVPVAGPAVLHALDLAVQKVKNGEVTPKNQDGLREYVFKGFSLLMR